VQPRRASFRRSAAEAAEQAAGLARSIGSVWSVEPTVNFSGGRDSRVSAAGFIAATVDVEFRTMDIEPGGHSPATCRRRRTAIRHTIAEPEQGSPVSTCASGSAPFT
jgi:hypothetical protein